MIRPPFLQSLRFVFVSTLTIQLLAFLRYVTIAAAFGISRDMDLYAVLLTIAGATVFVMATVFDNVAIPRLVPLAANRGAFEALAGRLLGLALLAAAGLPLLFLVAIPAMALAVGAAGAELERLRMLGLAFLPWLALCLPYYALGSILKARSRYRPVFTAELLVVATSLAAILAAPDRLELLPLAYGLGYAAGTALLWVVARQAPAWPRPGAPQMRGLFRNCAELFAAAQFGTLGSVVERLLQARLPAGSIAASVYTGLVVNNLATLLTFRDIFIVPLSETENRAQRMGRLLAALSLVALPTAVLLSITAEPVLRLLFERGRFDAEAVALSTAFLQVQALGLWPSLLLAPMLRMFQVLDRVRFTMLVYLTGSATLLLLGTSLVVGLDGGPRGFAAASVGSSLAACAAAWLLLRRAGLGLSAWLVAGHAGFAALASALAGAVALAVPLPGQPLLQVAWQGGAFAAVLGACYLMARHRLVRLIR